MGNFAGFLAAKHAMERHGVRGRLKFLGEPAEKMCGSKPVHAAHGYYDGLDAPFSFHPHSFPHLTNGVMWETSCSAYWSRLYTFECEHAETWNAGGAGGMVHPHASARAPGTFRGVPACINPMWSTAARVIGLSILDLLMEPALLERAEAEFNERTGRGIGGSGWIAPLLPKGLLPRWTIGGRNT